jgi:hypothetical protein
MHQTATPVMLVFGPIKFYPAARLTDFIEINNVFVYFRFIFGCSNRSFVSIHNLIQEASYE